MRKLRYAIVSGLAQSGRERSIIDILNEAGLAYTKSQLVAAMRHLEALGIIRPIRQNDLTAELTTFGQEVLLAAR